MAGLIVALQILFVQQLTEDSKAMLTKYLSPFILVQRKVYSPLEGTSIACMSQFLDYIDPVLL